MERRGSYSSQPKRGVPRSEDKGKSNGNGGSSSRRDPDHYMPMASLTRIMRRVLPDHAKVSDDAKEAMQECVAAFIAHLTREANNRCHREYRRTITPDDAVSAMAALGFHDYVEPLTLFINKHRAQAQDQYHPPPRPAAAVEQQQPPPTWMLPMTPPMSPTAGLQLPSQMPPMTPPPSPAVSGYVPYPPEDSVEVRDYFAGYGGGGEGYSGDADFDPFE